MLLKNWRVDKGLSQEEMAERLSKFAKKRLPQRTLASWEQGTFPRNFWRKKIIAFTSKEVTVTDLLVDAK